MVSSGGRLGADLMKQVTQRPADTIELFFFFLGGKKTRRREKKVEGKMLLSLQINIKSYCKEVRIAWTPGFLKIRWEIPWLNFDEVDLGEAVG